MSIPKIFADFNNRDRFGRVRLSVAGAIEDIREKRIDLKEGVEILLDDNDSLKAIRQIKFSNEENIWVAEIDESLLNLHPL